MTRHENRSFVIDMGEGDSLEVNPDRRRPRALSGPGAALEAHLEGLRWLLGPKGIQHFRTIVKERVNAPAITGTGDIAQGALSMLAAAMNANSTTYVSPEMMGLVGALTGDLGESHFHLMDLPDEAGVVLWGGPGVQSDLVESAPEVGAFVKIRGFTYHIIPRGGRITRLSPVPVNGQSVYLNYQLNPAADSEPRYNFVTQAIENGGVMVWPFYDSGEYLVETGAWEGAGRPPFLPMRAIAIGFGAKPDYDEEMVESRQMRALVVTLFRLMWQRVINPEPYVPTRAESRRVDRLRGKLPLDGERYKVVHLRRYEGLWQSEPVSRGERGPLRYRVVVRGHSRNQYYPTLGPARHEDGTWNEESHRTIWIDPHMRGEGPLVLKHNVSAFVR